jgi:hypothetical protein
MISTNSPPQGVRINEDGRFWLFLVLLVCCITFIPFIFMSVGSVSFSFLWIFPAIAAASVAGIITEWKKIKQPEESAGAKFIGIETLNAGDFQGMGIKDMMNVATCAIFEFNGGKTQKLHFHSSKLEKKLSEYKDTKIEIYYKEYKGKYWLTGFDETCGNLMQETRKRISIKRPLAILSIILCLFLITVGVFAVTGGLDSLNDQLTGKVQYSDFEVKPLDEFYIELSVTPKSEETKNIVCAVNPDTVYFHYPSTEFEVFLEKDGDGNVICVCVRDKSSGEIEEVTDEKYIETFKSQYNVFVEALDFQQFFTKEQFKKFKKVEKLGNEKVAGRECALYSLNADNGEIQIWIDQETNYIIKREEKLKGEHYYSLLV